MELRQRTQEETKSKEPVPEKLGFGPQWSHRRAKAAGDLRAEAEETAQRRARQPGTCCLRCHGALLGNPPPPHDGGDNRIHSVAVRVQLPSTR